MEEGGMEEGEEWRRERSGGRRGVEEGGEWRKEGSGGVTMNRKDDVRTLAGGVQRSTKEEQTATVLLNLTRLSV